MYCFDVMVGLGRVSGKSAKMIIKSYLLVGFNGQWCSALFSRGWIVPASIR